MGKSLSEEWRDIPEFDGYEVSNLGVVRGKDRLRKCGSSSYRVVKGQEMK